MGSPSPQHELPFLRHHHHHHDGHLDHPFCHHHPHVHHEDLHREGVNLLKKFCFIILKVALGLQEQKQ